MKPALLGLIVLLAACGGGGSANDTSAADTSPGDTTTASGSVDRLPPKPLHVTERGIGAVHAGMTLAELREAVTRLSFRSGEDSTGCAYPTIDGLPDGVLVMIDKGVVARIDVARGDIPTTEGVRIGDDTTDLRQAYGARVSASPHKYTDGKYYTVVPQGDSLHRIIFETNHQGVVLRYRAGKLPQVAWVESCS
jgi:hypothetical protein